MAKTTGALKHTHKYFRRHDGLWACAGLDGCTHYMPKNMAPLPIGQLSICHRCDKSFQMVQYHMIDDEPKCDTCMEELEKIEVATGLKDDTGFSTVGMNEKSIAIIKRAMERNKPKPQPEEIEPDQVEVFEPDEEHALTCMTRIGLDCDCKEEN